MLFVCLYSVCILYSYVPPNTTEFRCGRNSDTTEFRCGRNSDTMQDCKFRSKMNNPENWNFTGITGILAEFRSGQ